MKPPRQGKILPQFLIITSQAEENYSLPPGSVLRKSMSSLKDYCNSGVKKHFHKILANVFKRLIGFSNKSVSKNKTYFLFLLSIELPGNIW